MDHWSTSRSRCSSSHCAGHISWKLVRLPSSPRSWTTVGICVSSTPSLHSAQNLQQSATATADYHVEESDARADIERRHESNAGRALKAAPSQTARARANFTVTGITPPAETESEVLTQQRNAERVATMSRHRTLRCVCPSNCAARQRCLRPFPAACPQS